MKNHKKIGVVGILGHEKINSLITEFEKAKTIDDIIREEESIKITMPYKTHSYDLDIKTLLRNERSVIPSDFYNKRKKK